MIPNRPSKAQLIYREALERARTAIAKPTTTAPLESAIEQIEQSLDDGCAELDKMALAAGRPKVDCKPGCDHCCYRVVPVRIPEVLRTAAYIKAHFTSEERQAVAARLYEYERAVAPNFGTDLPMLRPRCPLLVNGLCSAYEARPFVCRGTFSFDVKKCELSKLHPDEYPAIPAVPGRNELALASGNGVAQALAEAKLPFGLYDFGRALKIALETEEATKEVSRDAFEEFDPAVGREREELFEPPAMNPPQQTYSPGQYASGKFDLSALALPFYIGAIRGDLPNALKLARGAHPAYAIWRMRVPHSYESVEEVLEWRAYFERAVKEFAKSDYDPREAYDGLYAYASELSYQQFNNRELLSEVGSLFCDGIAARALPDFCRPIEAPRKPGKPRIGYISSYLKKSSVAPWALGWLENQGEDIEKYAYHLFDIEDAVTDRFKQLTDHFFHLPPSWNAQDGARLIKSHDLDLLIFLDAGAEPRVTQYAVLRLARNQACAWGAPETTGFPTIDYYLSGDDMEPPNGQEHYSEQLVRFPGIGVNYLREGLHASTLVKSDFGLDNGPLLVSVQHPAKFAPQWDELYLKINQATGRPIVLVNRDTPSFAPLCRRFERKGIKYVLLPKLPFSDYLGLLKAADVVLDTPGWNGGVTTIHALDFKMPVVTLPTDLKRGIQSSAMLKAANAQPLIAKDVDDYVSIAADSARVADAQAQIMPEGLHDDLRPCEGLNELLSELTRAS